MATWTVICAGDHRDRFVNVYHAYGTDSRTAFEIPADTREAAKRIATNAGLRVLYVFE